jgi:excisionase family DNA binding protein
MSVSAHNKVGQTKRRRKAPVGPIVRRWYTVPEVADMLGYGASKVRMMVISGDIRSLKDGGSRRILPQWVDEYVERRAAEAEADANWPRDSEWP